MNSPCCKLDPELYCTYGSVPAGKYGLNGTGRAWHRLSRCRLSVVRLAGLPVTECLFGLLFFFF